MDTETLTGFSDSAIRAARWATAAAAYRADKPPGSNGFLVEPADLLLGVLLAHPDPDGEGRVLLTHFGLTARDVLPEDYPSIDSGVLDHYAAQVDATVRPPLSPATARLVSSARHNNGSAVQVVHLLGALLDESDTSLRWDEAFTTAGQTQDGLAESYRRWLDTEPAARNEVAGQLLRDWLRRENPRHPVDVPVYASDRIDADRDLIGIRREADAFAYLMASRDLQPPLAVGLFGDWGSGKSFLMRSIQARILRFRRLVGDQPQREVPVWRNVVQIEFNAWEYVQGNLWAALLERIFRELGSMPVPGLVETRRAPLILERDEVEQSVQHTGEQIRTLQTRAAGLERELESARQKVEDARLSAERSTAEQLEKVRETAAKAALTDLWGAVRVQVLEERGVDLVDALSDARSELKRGHALLGPYWRQPKHIVLISLGALAIPAVTLLLAWANVPPVAAALGGLSAVVPLVTTSLRTSTTWARERLAAVEEAQAQVLEQAQQPVVEAEKNVATVEQNLEGVRRQMTELETAEERARQRQRALSDQLEELTPARVLIDFADERSTDYRRRLGLLSVVRADLQKLENQIRDNNILVAGGTLPAPPAAEAGSATEDSPADPATTRPRPDVPNRIILYIDDLDRCPPVKVVEVLEAVHLLLAFKMFVVVVAVDSRWLRSALTDQLLALRPSTAPYEQPTPKDYLEKIFQLPFWVQPMPAAAREQLVHGLLVDSVRAPAKDEAREPRPSGGLRLGDAEGELLHAMLSGPGGHLRLETSPLTLSEADLAHLESLAPLLGDTPRRVKRFVNTCQLLFAMAPRMRTDDSFAGPRRVVALVAAISEGLPCLAPRLFTALEQRQPGTLGSWLGDLVDIDEAERQRLTAWLALARNSGWAQHPLASLDVRVDMIRRLRFDKPDLV